MKALELGVPIVQSEYIIGKEKKSTNSFNKVYLLFYANQKKIVRRKGNFWRPFHTY